MKLTNINHLPAFEPKSSYYSPINLFIMDLNDDLVVEEYDGGVCLVRTLPITEQKTVTFLGPVSEDLVKKYQDSIDVVVESTQSASPFMIDRDNAEYVYSVEETVALKSKKYEQVRRKYNRVNKQICKCEICKLETLADMNIQKSIWSFFEEQREMEDINAQVEGMAFEKWLMFSEQLPTDLVIVTEDSKIVGFSVVEVVGKTLLIHFFKTEHSMVGLAEYLFVEIARMYQGKVEWINFQQDLGIAGLRQFKNHLQPTLQLLTFILN